MECYSIRLDPTIAETCNNANIVHGLALGIGSGEDTIKILTLNAAPLTSSIDFRPLCTEFVIEYFHPQYGC